MRAQEQASRAAAAAIQALGGDAVDSDDDDALNKQRAMDDWKDDHPFGAGNSKLRPTA